MICRPAGSPSSVKPIGATVAGRYDRLASPAKNNCSAYGADLPLSLTLHAAVISCCVLPVAQRKDLVAEVRRTVFAARGFWQSSCAHGSGIRFASDSPLEGDGFEPSVEGGGAGPKETAWLDLEADGTVSVYVGSAAVGQGLETIMAQIAADTLGLPLGQVRVLHGSTPFLDEGYGAFASRSTVLGGSAVRRRAATR
jgi:hypothetical protein